MTKNSCFDAQLHEHTAAGFGSTRSCVKLRSNVCQTIQIIAMERSTPEAIYFNSQYPKCPGRLASGRPAR
eukprot:314615-Karenia_brevis.AAC.1